MARSPLQARKADQIPYIEQLGDCWGELCVSKEVAMAWADRLVGVMCVPLSPDPNLRGYFPGTSTCLSALFCVERYAEIVELVGGDQVIWPYECWAVKALAAMGRKRRPSHMQNRVAGPERLTEMSTPSAKRLCSRSGS